MSTEHTVIDVGISMDTLAVPLFNDIILPAPVNQEVRSIFFGAINQHTESNANICTIFGAPVELFWSSVGDADYYILQVCRNSSFVGPTLRTFNVTHTGGASHSKIVYMGQEIFFSVTYYWRVMAVNNTGGASGKSEPWQITFSCPSFATNDGLTPSGSASASSSASASGGDTVTVVSDVVCSGTTLTVTKIDINATQA